MLSQVSCFYCLFPPSWLATKEDVQSEMSLHCWQISSEVQSPWTLFFTCSDFTLMSINLFQSITVVSLVSVSEAMANTCMLLNVKALPLSTDVLPHSGREKV